MPHVGSTSCLLLVLSCLVGIQFAISQERVCSYAVAKEETRQTYVIYTRLSSYSCYFISTCYRRHYYQQPVYRSYTVYYIENKCCEGYIGNAEQCSPICTECAESHLCLAPYTCVCPAEWSSNDCIEPPQNVTLTATGSDRLEFRWEPPPHNIHRQFATLYIVFFRNEAHFVNASSNLVMQLESLTPYTTYNCCVAANTTSGPSRLACTSQTTLR
ncbi:hypothetical protein GBAR_LOCUS24664, partial [Geodia barretti]